MGPYRAPYTSRALFRVLFRALFSIVGCHVFPGHTMHTIQGNVLRVITLAFGSVKLAEATGSGIGNLGDEQKQL